jgi:hypothetical protein
MNRFDQGSEPELLELNPNSSKFFISIEALNKLEKICSWFIEREKEYELYATINYSNSLQHEHDDSIEQQHCDINQVLNYYEIRRPFLDFTIKAYSKLNSLVSIKTLNKLFQLTDDNATAIDWRPHVIISDETATITTKLDEEETNSADSLNKSSSSLSASSLSASSLSASFKSKPVECIETFADNLDFGLRLLTHETQMLKFIYRNSTDTFNDLSSKFAVLIIEQIQKEFEEFLTNICDFTKTCNSGADVIYSLMILLIKVQHLKEKTNCLPREDLMTASKFLGFTMRLNEISAQIFSAFIDVVKRGHFMEFSIPENSSLHESTLRTCHFLNKLIENQEYLNEILKIVYETKLIKLTGGGLKHEQQQKHEQEHVEEQQDEEEKKEVEWLMALEKEEGEEEGEETAVNNNEPHPDNLQHHHHHKLSSYLKLKFKRLKNKINHDSASITGSMESLPTDSFYLAAYTQAIVDKHKEYLIEETQKTLHETSLLYNHQKLNIKKFLSNGSRSNANRFKSIQNEFLKSYLFLVNNLEHTVDQLANNQSAIYETIKVDVDVQFESSFNQLIQDYLDKSCEAYRLLERKWLKLLNNRDEEQQQHQFHLKFHHHQNLALKKTRKLDSFMKLLRETLQVSMETAIKKPETNQIFKQVVIHYLDPILSSIGDDHLNDDWVKTVLINEKHKNRMLLLNHQTKNDIPPLKSLIYERMFPS